jgi:hypothetical protein
LPDATITKYEATAKPDGENLWSITLEEVKYYAAAPDLESSRSVVGTQSFSGTEIECRAAIKKRMKKLVADRDAVINSNPFTIKEDDLV